MSKLFLVYSYENLEKSFNLVSEFLDYNDVCSYVRNYIIPELNEQKLPKLGADTFCYIVELDPNTTATLEQLNDEINADEGRLAFLNKYRKFKEEGDTPTFTIISNKGKIHYTN